MEYVKGVVGRFPYFYPIPSIIVQNFSVFFTIGTYIFKVIKNAKCMPNF